ncbi:MAG: hypothetical protein EOO88_47630, partial [Pedobacter sp.]
LEFSLSRNEVVNLLMTDELYGSPVLCIRELVQNAMDALRHRAAIFERDNAQKWTGGKVTMVHELDEHGHEVVRCTDNGIGMTQEIIENFLTNVGRSYYRSPEWEQERNSLKAKGVDFDPCAQFGIGFMSCFMLGDQIKIETRRFKGRQGEGEPLVVEINGLSGIVVIRKGDDGQDTGTTVSITGRKKPRFLDRNNDRVQLVRTLSAYVVNCEFPVRAECNIEEIKQEELINAGYSKPTSYLQSLGIKQTINIEQDLNQIHPLLDGVMIADFLVDENGELCLDNDEAAWFKPRTEGICITKKVNSEDKWYGAISQQISSDGILVLGDAGRGEIDKEWASKKIPSYELVEDTSGFDPSDFHYHANTRGILKPSLTPARITKMKFHNEDGEYLRQLLCQASGRIWDNVLHRPESQKNPQYVWSISLAQCNRYRTMFGLFWVPSESVFDCVSLPLESGGIEMQWKILKDLPEFTVIKDDGKFNNKFS